MEMMSPYKKTKPLIVRLTPTQHERLVNIAEEKGFKSISQYVRSVIFNQGMLWEMRLNEIHKIITNSTISIQAKDTPRYKLQKVKSKFYDQEDVNLESSFC